MDAETLSGFFFFAVVVTPTLSWILTPRRFTKMKGLLYSISFLAALTVCTIVSGSIEKRYDLLYKLNLLYFIGIEIL